MNFEINSVNFTHWTLWISPWVPLKLILYSAFNFDFGNPKTCCNTKLRKNASTSSRLISSRGDDILTESTIRCELFDIYFGYSTFKLCLKSTRESKASVLCVWCSQDQLRAHEGWIFWITPLLTGAYLNHNNCRYELYV